MSEKLQAVIFDGRTAIRISEQRGDPYKNRTEEHIEYHVMTPADAEWLGREIIRLARGGVNTPKAQTS